MSEKNNVSSNNKKTTKAKSNNPKNTRVGENKNSSIEINQKKPITNTGNKKKTNSSVTPKNKISTKQNSKNFKQSGNKSNRAWSLLLNIALVVAFCYAVILTLKINFPIKDYDIIKTYAEVNELNEELVCAIINVESGFDNMAVSNKGASGYMQLMEKTALWGIETLDIQGVTYDDIFDPELNIALGTWYLSNLINQFGSVDLAIISYNAGSGNVSKWLSENQGDEEATLQNIPFKETKNYYFKVKTNEYIYRFLLKYVYRESLLN